MLKSFAEILKRIQPGNWKTAYMLGLYLFGSKSDEVSLDIYIRCSLFVARYLLFIFTSLFYLAAAAFSPFYVKLIVVFFVFIATLLTQNLYNSWGG